MRKASSLPSVTCNLPGKLPHHLTQEVAHKVSTVCPTIINKIKIFQDNYELPVLLLQTIKITRFVPDLKSITEQRG